MTGLNLPPQHGMSYRRPDTSHIVADMAEEHYPRYYHRCDSHAPAKAVCAACHERWPCATFRALDSLTDRT